MGIFFTEGTSPDQNSYRKLVNVSLQCWQSQQICHVQTFSGLYRITISFHICFRILCFRPCWFPKSKLWWNLLVILWVRKKNSPRELLSRFFISQNNRLFSLICFQAAPAVLYFLVEFVEDMIIVEDHWADITLARVVDLTNVVVRCNSVSCYLLCRTQPFIETVPSFAYLLGFSYSTRIRTLELAELSICKVPVWCAY